MPTHTISNEQDLDLILSSHNTVVLDFWAKWCPPCRGFAPVFEAAAKQHTDMAFCRIDTEEAKELKEVFEVTSIPTLMIIRDRILVASQPGYLTKAALAELLEQARSLDMYAVKQKAVASSGDKQ